MEEKSELVELAKKHFDDLSEAEIKFFTAVEKEEVADYTSSNEEENNPENADQWGNDRVLHAKKIKWLCTDPKAAKLVTHQGIQIKGARIEGELNLQFVEMGFPLVFSECAFDKTIYLQYAQIRVLHLGGTHTGRIEADSLDVKGSVFLNNGFKAKGGVRLGSATIGGNLECDNSEFIKPSESIDPDGRALFADGINVKGSVFLRNGFKAKGEVRLPGANIGEMLDCIKGEFINPGKDALVADGINVKGSVLLRDDFKAQGAVRLLGATIGGDLDCSRNPKKKTKGGEFINPMGKAINADRLNVKGCVFLSKGFKAEGEVRLLGAEIGGNLECDNSEFINPKGKAFCADRLKVKGSVFLDRGFKAKGEVRLLGAEIDGIFNCAEGEFINPWRDELNADGEKWGAALNAEGLRVKRNVFLRDGFKAEGKVSLVGATINDLVYTGVISPGKAELDLRSAKIGTLWDEEKSWPKKGNLYLHGLVYDSLDGMAPKDFKSRIEWLRLNGGKEFSPQPYEQLAEVLKRSGHKKDATEVLIAKNKDIAELGTELSITQWLWYKFLGPMIGYGYKPLNVFWKGPMGIWFFGSILFWLVLGGGLFWTGYYGENRIMSPINTDVYAKSDEDVSDTNATINNEYPTFQFITYSIDAFLPLVDLHQSKYWLPNANKGNVLLETRWFKIRSGGLFLVYLWCHIAVGWILSTLFVVGLTGLVRK